MADEEGDHWNGHWQSQVDRRNHGFFTELPVRSNSWANTSRAAAPLEAFENSMNALEQSASPLPQSTGFLPPVAGLLRGESPRNPSSFAAFCQTIDRLDARRRAAMLPATQAQTQMHDNEPGPRVKPLHPITTVASAIPKTPYVEEGTERSPSYVQVQIALLKWLATNAADTLTARQASAWTAAIDPITKKPTTACALRLCYYMRSQGFDTYATVKQQNMTLFVVNQNISTRRAENDLMYWQQNTENGDIIFSASRTSGGMRANRRNALVVDDLTSFVGASDVNSSRLETLLDELRVGNHAPAARGGDGEGGVPVNSAEQPTRNVEPSLQILMTEAEGNLDRLLRGDNLDDAAVEAAIERVQELHRRMDRE